MEDNTCWAPPHVAFGKEVQGGVVFKQGTWGACWLRALEETLPQVVEGIRFMQHVYIRCIFRGNNMHINVLRYRSTKNTTDPNDFDIRYLGTGYDVRPRGTVKPILVSRSSVSYPFKAFFSAESSKSDSMLKGTVRALLQRFPVSFSINLKNTGMSGDGGQNTKKHAR